MRIAQVQDSLDQFARAEGVDLRLAPTATLVDTVVAWYVAERANDALGFDDDGDMLLFQWGTIDRGSGPEFQYDLTRQLTSAHAVDDDAIWQLGITRYFENTDQTENLGSGERWCPTPAQVPSFQAYIVGSVASVLANASSPIRTEVRFGLAG